MTIAIHISTGRKEKVKDSFNFICFTKLAAEHPSHHFIFIFETQPDPELYLDPNCTPVIAPPLLKNNLLRHYWYNYKIPGVLERYNADVFVTAGNTCSIRTRVPQCMIIETLSLSGKNTGGYLKKYLPSFLQTAKAICVTNPVIAEEIIKKYNREDKVSLLYPGFNDDMVPLEWQEKERMKEKHSNGLDFFLFEADVEGMYYVVTVLKAFSIFKKWQKSEMQLVIILNAPLSPALSKDFASYKYRNEVIMVQADEESKLLPAAYAAISFTSMKISETGLHAMRCGIPFITIEHSTTRKVFSDAALYVGTNEKDIAEKMMLLYKDEHLLRDLTSKGIALASRYSWPDTLVSLWKVINSIAKQ